MPRAASQRATGPPAGPPHASRITRHVPGISVPQEGAVAPSFGDRRDSRACGWPSGGLSGSRRPRSRRERASASAPARRAGAAPFPASPAPLAQAPGRRWDARAARPRRRAWRPTTRDLAGRVEPRPRTPPALPKVYHNNSAVSSKILERDAAQESPPPQMPYATCLTSAASRPDPRRLPVLRPEGATHRRPGQSQATPWAPGAGGFRPWKGDIVPNPLPNPLPNVPIRSGG